MRSSWLDYLGLAVVAGAMIWLLSIAGCSPDPVTPSPGLPLCPQACNMLERLGCPEGESSTCSADCERLSKLGYVWMGDDSGPECVVKSDGTIAGVQACNIQCER